MSIQFSCPSCRQPIEVDDDWGDQQVSCPFCNKVVTAPARTTLASGSVPPARGVNRDEGFHRVELPTVAGGGATGAPPASPLRRWGFILMITGWIFLGVVVVVQMQKMGPILQEVMRDAGTTPEEQQKAMVKALEETQKRMANNPNLMMGVALGQGFGIMCLLGGVVFGILSISRGERPMTLQVVTIVMSALPMLCLCLGAIAMMGMAGMG